MNEKYPIKLHAGLGFAGHTLMTPHYLKAGSLLGLSSLAPINPYYFSLQIFLLFFFCGKLGKKLLWEGNYLLLYVMSIVGLYAHNINIFLFA